MNAPHERPIIIGLTGLPRTGKDTVANMLVDQHGFIKLAFADELYAEVALAFGVTEEDLRSGEWKSHSQSALMIKNCEDTGFVDMARKMELFMDEPCTSRAILQLWGTEYRRWQFGHDYWSKKLIDKTPDYRSSSLVFSDVREPHEMLAGFWLAHRRGYHSFTLVEVTRPGAVRTVHSSDNGLPAYYVDKQVLNDGTLDHLNLQVEAILSGVRENTYEH